MDVYEGSYCNSNNSMQLSDDQEDIQDQMEMRRGPWTVEEDLMLMNYVANHGEGRWNSLARCAGNLFTQNRLLYTDQKTLGYMTLGT